MPNTCDISPEEKKKLREFVDEFLNGSLVNPPDREEVLILRISKDSKDFLQKNISKYAGLLSTRQSEQFHFIRLQKVQQYTDIIEMKTVRTFYELHMYVAASFKMNLRFTLDIVASLPDHEGSYLNPLQLEVLLQVLLQTK